MTEPSSNVTAFELRYHVPYSQVHPGSRGAQDGAVHLHAVETVTLQARLGRCGTLTVNAGVALCRKRGWWEREVEHEHDLRVRCSECTRRAKRYGVDWPEEAGNVAPS